MDRSDTIGIQRRIALLSDKRDEIWNAIEKEIPENQEVHGAYKELFDAFFKVICTEAKFLVSPSQQKPQVP